MKASYLNDPEKIDTGPLVYEKEIILVDLHTYIQRLNDKVFEHKNDNEPLTDYSAFFGSK